MGLLLSTTRPMLAVMSQLHQHSPFASPFAEYDTADSGCLGDLTGSSASTVFLPSTIRQIRVVLRISPRVRSTDIWIKRSWSMTPAKFQGHLATTVDCRTRVHDSRGPAVVPRLAIRVWSATLVSSIWTSMRFGKPVKAIRWTQRLRPLSRRSILEAAWRGCGHTRAPPFVLVEPNMSLLTQTEPLRLLSLERQLWSSGDTTTCSLEWLR